MNGKIYIIGTGPGAIEYMCQRAINAIAVSQVIVGYKTYTKQIESLLEGKELLSSGMRQEVERCRQVIDIALDGKTVSMISSGDAGIYGMAGVILEMLATDHIELDVEVVPGITSAISSASLVGAPLMNDFAVISLSDLMTPWEVIVKRIECAAMGDFAIALYNPKSRERVKQIEIFRDILLKYRSPETPVGIVRDAMREGCETELTTLEDMLNHEIDMTTTLIVGNSQTYVAQGRMITPRGYKL